MKKNILTIIVMAVSIVNLVLGIVLVFSIVPASNKTAALVDKVASVIDLNIDDPNSEEQDYTIDDLVAYTKTYDSAVNIKMPVTTATIMRSLPVLQFLLTAKPMIIKR